MIQLKKDIDSSVHFKNLHPKLLHLIWKGKFLLQFFELLVTLFNVKAQPLFYLENYPENRPPPTLPLVPPVPSPADFPYKYHRSHLLLPYFTLQPMKMERIEGSETSAIINQMPGNYPKGNFLTYIKLIFFIAVQTVLIYICFVGCIRIKQYL